MAPTAAAPTMHAAIRWAMTESAPRRETPPRYSENNGGWYALGSVTWSRRNRYGSMNHRPCARSWPWRL